MSGHSKWSTIKRKKAVRDAQKGAVFTKLAREITVAAKIGGGNPEANFRLRLAIQKAKEANMPNANIDRAIKKGTGESGEAIKYEEITYEGYGPAGVAILVDVMTDNRNRASSSIKHIFHMHGGNLGETGCVSWIFQPKGLILINSKNHTPEDVMLTLIDLGAEDVNDDQEGTMEVTCKPEQFELLKEKIIQSQLVLISAEVTKIPKSIISITDTKQAEQLLHLLEALEDNEDVQKTYANFDIPKEILATITS